MEDIYSLSLDVPLDSWKATVGDGCKVRVK